MTHKKRRRPAVSNEVAARRPDVATATDPLDGTASIAPVTSEMLDHAAHEAAEQTESVARGTASDAPAEAAPPVVASEASDPGPIPDDAAPRPPEAKIDRAATGPGDAFGRCAAKTFEIAVGNLSAAGDLMTALFGAKSLPEAAAINADHARRRFDAMATDGREFVLLAQAMAFEAMRLPDGPSRKS